MDLPEDDRPPVEGWESTVMPFEPESLTDVLTTAVLERLFGQMYLVVFPRNPCGHVGCGLATIASGMSPDQIHQMLVDAATALHPDNRH